MMEAQTEVKEFKNLLQPLLQNGQKIIHYEAKPLMALGENYGSYLISFIVKLSNNETLNLVAKLCPPNDFLKKLFCVHITVSKEIETYRTIFPILTDFIKESNAKTEINFLARYYGSRKNLKENSEEIDDDAVLLLENLKISGYKVVDRTEGFNFEISNLLMQRLAIFHALPIAFKLAKPVQFEKCILPHLKAIRTTEIISVESFNLMVGATIKTASNLEKLKPFVKRFEKAIRNYDINKWKLNENFVTLNHNDFWVNNAMIKFEHEKPIDCKILDFQFLSYGSPGRDLVFFLFTSVQTETFYNRYEDLLKIYYNTFINTLKEFHCDLTDFTYHNLKKEMEFSAKATEIFHVMYMLNPIFSPKENVKNLSELTEHDMVIGTSIDTEPYLKKFEEKTLQFVHMNWI